ncbi:MULTISPECIES: alpha/beta hydrolase [unclassified Halomonas]|uniref:alpha/beta fold hydrolase n=1 Tax=unclassified Halomonas TaxID=2609666 RepID=UPI0013F4EC09|nr:alpha/beta hydrolase [Halomonas sp. ALS9]MBT2787207.1 alpha/beta hydrolase [Halomonas sp. ISL-106]MBT2796429.1 alpha/beta hydrolase [Halomonas sp. ISL-104]
MSKLYGGDFELLAIEKAGNGSTIYLYLEGDGRPWVSGGSHVSDDPSPRRPYLLPIMLDSPGPALYLGRPCYFGLGPKRHCHPTLWTFSRYSDRVIMAMVEAAEQWLATYHEESMVTLVGHSGGGVLALLMAERLPQVNRVIAMATPVSLSTWAQQHDYFPLFDSLDPMTLQNWRSDVERHFLFGSDDRVVPPGRFAPLARTIPGSKVEIVRGQGHRCCTLHPRVD